MSSPSSSIADSSIYQSLPTLDEDDLQDPRRGRPSQGQVLHAQTPFSVDYNMVGSRPNDLKTPISGTIETTLSSRSFTDTNQATTSLVRTTESMHSTATIVAPVSTKAVGKVHQHQHRQHRQHHHNNHRHHNHRHHNHTLRQTSNQESDQHGDQDQDGQTTTVSSRILSEVQSIPLSTYVAISQVAITSVLKVAMVSTSLSLGIARTVVSGVDKILNVAVKGVTGQSEDQLISPATIASLPFRAAILGINFSDILVKTILEAVDGSVNLALTTVQDGLDLLDNLFGPDSTSQTGETFREVWAMLSREFYQTDEQGNMLANYPAFEGLRLFMAYVAIQYATSDMWETIRVRTQGRLVGECLESKDEKLGSSTAWSALAAWPEEWTRDHLGLNADELLEEQRLLELRNFQNQRSSPRSSSPASDSQSSTPGSAAWARARMASRTPNVELTNFLATSYRFSRFCSAMYGETLLELMGAPERFPPPPAPSSGSPTLSQTPPSPTSTFPPPPASVAAAAASASFAASAPPAGSLPRQPRSRSPLRRAQTDPYQYHFYNYTGTPLGSILYSSDEAATIQDGLYSPRYYLLDDVETKQIVLVMRGTKSLHDVMIDLTCDTSDLWLDHDTTPDTRRTKDGKKPLTKKPFKVHSGFLKAARTIASPETIGIQEKIKAALETRPDYSLLLIGHSLGAGIASILSLLWADPATGLTPEVPSHLSMRSSSAAPLVGLGLTSGLVLTDRTRSRPGQGGVRASTSEYLPGYLGHSGPETFLPPGRRVRCHAYGTPKVMCPRLSKRAIKLVTSISYGDDVVGRLSLGSVRNIGHAMRALLAMRPMPQPTTPPSPPSSPSPGSSPNLECEVLHETEDETLEELLECEGDSIIQELRDRRQQEEDMARELELAQQAEAGTATTEGSRKRNRDRRDGRKKQKEKTTQPAYKSIGLEIVQKVIRWKLTKDERLFDEFMEIRRAMAEEMERHQESFEEGSDDEEEKKEQEREARSHEWGIIKSKVSPVLVPAGKVLWIRPTPLEKELENTETRQHPVDSVLHQFEWDHPIFEKGDPGSVLSHQLQQRLEEHRDDSASIRSFKSTIRSSLYSSSPNAANASSGSISGGGSPVLPSSSSLRESEAGEGRDMYLNIPGGRPLARRNSFDSIATIESSTTTSAACLHPENENTDKVLYRMYAVPNPENVFDEMLFSRRMWSDHLPLTYEFILAGKHAISVTTPHANKNSNGKSGKFGL
ncbi:hypothetical protein BGW38_003271 [Lunasporangiospora selenospora]|uniref:sn-1-specific diacylglycerol lipase n=1 Tax=Lunasporangiospora selenospora TaxID=979761 RepID=A0A9P6FQW9_9FUNG|nr:hypothetical protein BGW38_003271 [Lunasporangiospora selenospora]